jgi:hypothetical protein
MRHRAKALARERSQRREPYALFLTSDRKGAFGAAKVVHWKYGLLTRACVNGKNYGTEERNRQRKNSKRSKARDDCRAEAAAIERRKESWVTIVPSAM